MFHSAKILLKFLLKIREFFFFYENYLSQCFTLLRNFIFPPENNSHRCMSDETYYIIIVAFYSRSCFIKESCDVMYKSTYTGL
jgi:hypothetical protein